MGLLRRDATVRFQMREEMISIGDDYWIEDSDGHKAYRVNGKVARVRETWVLEDKSGKEVATIRERKLTVRDSIKIEAGGTTAIVKKALIGLRDRFNVELDGFPDIKVHGRIGDHEYEIEQDGDKIGEVSKKWFRVRDTYGVEVFGKADPALILAITVAVDALAHD